MPTKIVRLSREERLVRIAIDKSLRRDASVYIGNEFNGNTSNTQGHDIFTILREA